MSGITRIRNKNFDKWFTINLEIQDLDADVLSPEGKTLHTYLASKPDKWIYNRKHAIQKIGSGHKLDKAAKELKALGLLVIEKDRDDRGRICGYNWQIEVNLPDPHPDNQDTGDGPYPDRRDPVRRDPDIPDPDNQDTYKRYHSEEKQLSSEKQTARAPKMTPLPLDKFLDLDDTEPKHDPDLETDLKDPPPRSGRPPSRRKATRSPETPRHDAEGFAKVSQAWVGPLNLVLAAKSWDKLKPDSETVAEMLHVILDRNKNCDKWKNPQFAGNLHKFLDSKGWKERWFRKKDVQQAKPQGAAAASDGKAHLWAVINGEA